MLDKPLTSKVQRILEDFGNALAQGDIDRAVEMFVEDCYWRDIVTFTWNIKTMEGKPQVAEMLRHQLEITKPGGWRLTDGEIPTEDGGVTTAWIEFETELARGSGLARIRDGKIWTLLTAMTELKGHEEKKGVNRPFGAVHGAHKDRTTWKEEREAEQSELGYSRQPYVLIVGGGQGGIAVGARLKQLGVPTIIAEKNDRPGDSWRNRYKSLCLHDPVWYDHLPYIKFPDNWPIFSPKDKMGDWLESYTKVMELNYWTRTTCKSATYDEAAREWSVVVDRDGEEVVLKPKHIVMATGMSGKPSIPDVPGIETFKGELHHSSKHPGPDAYAGKKCVVIGSNNSAHDICHALWEHDADVTMVQRSGTTVVRSNTSLELGLGPLYSEEALANGLTTEKADMIFASFPYRIVPESQIPICEAMQARDAEFYAALKDAGFEVDWGPDGAGIFPKYLARGAGYYIDVGASQLIIDGKIKLAKGEISKIVEDGVVLADGTKLEADLIVFATGYESMNQRAAELVGPQVAKKVGKVWGLGSGDKKDPGPWEGELRNMWKPTRQEGLWFHGGNLAQSRQYSLFLALQLKARMEGLPTEVYGLPEVNHES